MTATDQLTGKLLEIINQIQQGVIAHAPDAINLTLASIKVDSFQNLFLGFLGLISIAILILIAFRIKALIDKDKLSDKESYDKLDWDQPMIMMYFILGGVFGFFILILSLIAILNIWNYIGIVNPKLYLAHELIQKVTQ